MSLWLNKSVDYYLQEEKERREQEEQRKKQDEDAKKKKALTNMTHQYGGIQQKVSSMDIIKWFIV